MASLLLLAGAGSVHDATAQNETRTLSFHHTHSNEDLTVTFKHNGRYDEAALKELNHYLRDWRTQDQTVMDPHLFDIIWEVYRDVGGQKPIQIISSYRSPATNAMLHRRSSGVARFSQHMLGHAMDFFIPDVPLEQIRFAGLRLQRGGVGFYPTSGSPFVHLDTGGIRHWPRHDPRSTGQGVPRRRTVHMPSDGKPMKGYELARADIENRDGNDSALKKSNPSLWAALFKHKSNDDEDDEAVSSPMPTAQQLADAAAAMSAAVAAPKPPTKSAAASRRCRCRAQNRVSARRSSSLPPTRRSSNPQNRPGSRRPGHRLQRPKPRPQTPADIINARGFWGDIPPRRNRRRLSRSPPKARQAVAAADPQPTASISAAFQALAYAPAANAPVDRANIVAATRADAAHIRPAGCPQCHGRHDDQHGGRQGRAGPGQRGPDVGADRGGQRQRHLDARR